MSKQMKVLLPLTLALLMNTPFLSHAKEHATHYPGIFLGSTKFDGETNFTYGLEYEYRLTSSWGLGGAYERINKAHHGDGATVWTAMGFYHPMKSIKLGIGVGQERLGGGHPKNKELIRFAAAYEYHLTDRIEVAPTIDIDLIDGDVAFVAGLAFLVTF